MCAGRYCHKPAQMVDHIKQIKQPDGSVDMQLALDINNLQPLCNRCHAVKRGVERAASRKYKQRELLAEHDDYQETYYAE
jgi:5-methylcytosine-specific restriction endonuclease McrA